ncbi:hypothetical protein ACIQ9P_38710 [Kitasatospora sp. NPDC094019]|uniref:hypothetical protein n=1 Tax=Kitasatospora sp. NPDC094019 TaxID=3364091 RepID=UPI00382569D9
MGRTVENHGWDIIVVVAAEELLADTTVPESQCLALRGDRNATAACTAAKSGDRGYAFALIAESTDSAAAAGRSSGLVDGVQGVALHEVSVHYELRDAGQAIGHARTVDPTALPTAERQARFLTDVARAFDQWGEPEQCYRALLAAEHAAPQEVRRGAVRDLAVGLLRHDRRLPGVRGLRRPRRSARSAVTTAGEASACPESGLRADVHRRARGITGTEGYPRRVAMTRQGLGRFRFDHGGSLWSDLGREYGD